MDAFDPEGWALLLNFYNDDIRKVLEMEHFILFSVKLIQFSIKDFVIQTKILKQQSYIAS